MRKGMSPPLLVFLVGSYRQCCWQRAVPRVTLRLHTDVACVFCHVWVYGTPWTAAHQVPVSMGFPRQEYWSRLPFPPPEDLPELGTTKIH